MKIAQFIGIIVLTVMAILSIGWSLSMMWLWFVVPVFNFPALTLPQAHR